MVYNYRLYHGLQVNITWLLQALHEEGPVFKSLGSSTTSLPHLRIDRGVKGCSTPRRNPDVDKAFAHFTMFAQWV